MNSKLTFLLFWIILFFLPKSWNSYAQFQDLHFEYLNIDNGLSQNRVNCILRDSKGYLWVGTQSGLNKYDGQKNIIYKNNPFQPNSISGNNIECIYEARSEVLWFGTTKGLNLYDRKTESFKSFFITTDPVESLNSIENNNRIFSIAEDRKGNLWCATLNGMNILSYPECKFQKFNIPVADNYYETNAISSIVADSAGFFWLGTQNNQLWRLNPETFQMESFTDSIFAATSGIFKNLIIDKSGKIWIGTDGKGLFSFDPKARKFVKYSTSGDGAGTHGNLIKGFFLDGERYLYISVDLGGLNRLDLNTNRFEYCLMNEKLENGLNSNAVWRVYKDTEDILYVGTSVAGLNIYNPEKARFRTYRHSANYENSLVYNVVFKFFEDSQGLIWIGTDGGGVSIFDPVHKTFKNYRHNSADPNSISRNAVLAITEDQNHDIWLGTWGAGLNRYDRKTGKFFRFMPDTANLKAISNPNIWDLYTDSKGKIWISYDWSGVDVFDIRNGVIKKYRNNSHDSTLFCPLMTNRFIRQKDGIMGLASPDGYFVLDSVTRIFRPVKELMGYNLSDLYLDRAGNYWAGTGNAGIIQVKSDGSTEKYNESNGFPSNSISGIMEDSTGNIWFLTSSGLAEFNTVMHKFRYFSFSDGLQGKQFTSYARLKANDGTFYIGGFNGFNTFKPENISVSSYLPKVYIDEFRIFNEPVPIDSLNSPLKQSIKETKEIVLSSKQSVFSFGFTAINFTYPEKALYAYKMEGYDARWNYTNAERRYVSYTNLDPGQYTFLVKASNNDGVWNETPASIKITINPPFWKTLWFKIFVTLCLTAIIISFYRFRINTLKRQKKILEGKVKERTAELQEMNVTLVENQEEILQQNESISHQRDILELKNAELEEKNLKIVQITNQLHESDQQKIRFFTNISHDLRTPLTLILGYLESIVPSVLNNRVISERLAVVTNNANRLVRLVNQLLDFQKIDAESFKLHTEMLDAVEFTSGVYNSFSLQAESRKINFRMATNTEQYVTWFDPDKLDKILFNLLSNAFKFTPDGGEIILDLTICIEDLNIESEAETLIFKVTDSGVGIREEDLDKIFDRFYQADNSLSKKYQGSGIGLALTKHLVGIHKGKISVTSQPEKGSCFEVIIASGKSMEALPVIQENETRNTIPNSAEPFKNGQTVTETSDAFNGSSILIVEDNDELRKFIRDELGGRFRIFEAGNGKQGIEAAVQEQPDLIISDVMMPLMDGFEMCGKLKENWQTSHIPIILLTAKADEESLYQGIETGADAYIRKPFHLKHLLIQIENLLKNRKKIFERFRISDPVSVEAPVLITTDAEFLNKLKKVIEEHLADKNFGVEELADAVNMSRSQLYKKTLSGLNISAGELIRTIRLKNAATFLLDPGNAVSDVAFMVGFADRPQFSRSFTSMFGISPKEFRSRSNAISKDNSKK